MKFVFPLVLSDRITLPSGVTGRIPFDVGQLQAPNNEAMAVHEIRFFCDLAAIVPPNNYNPPNTSDAGPFLRVSIRVGPYLICDSVPMWGLSASRDNTLEGAVWRFPLKRPLFVPPGMGFNVTAERRPQTVLGVVAEPGVMLGNPVFLSCTLVGRVVTEDFPRTTPVPYVSVYAPDALAQGTALRSGQQDLVNQLDVPVDVLYGLGRIAHVRQQNRGTPTLLFDFDCSDISLAMLSTLAWKTQAIFHDAEFHVAFDPCSRVVGLAGLTLPAGERLSFQANAPVLPALAVLTPVADAWMPVVSIVADRKENV